MNQHAGDPSARSDRLELPPFAALRAFEAIGRCGGIRKAALVLSIDHTVVSRHLRTLEAWLGVTLYDRNVGLTDAGRSYYERVSRAIHDIANATAETIVGKELARLKICCVPGFGFQWLAGRLAGFRARHPEVELEFHPTDQIPDLLRHEADIDIRYASDAREMPLPAAVRSHEFARSQAVAVASPDYLARVAQVACARDLLGLTLVHEESNAQWRTFLAANGVVVEGELGGPRMWHAHATLEAARSGEGVVLTNRFLLRDDLRQGRLVLVGPPEMGGFARSLGGYRLMASHTRWRQPTVEAFRRWLAAEVARDVPCAG